MKARWVGAAAAIAAVVAMAAPAGAAPTNAKNATVFPESVCVSTTGSGFLVTDFVVNGNGRAGANTSVGIVHPLDLKVTIDGVFSPEESFVKNNVGKADWVCRGETSFDTPDGPVTVAFTALATIS